MDIFNIVIIGAGFGGIGMAARLRHAGERDLVILEKQAGPGGVWHDNTYPGAACDIPSHLYCFSFEPCFDWSRRFAPRDEIHAYLRHCADKHGVLPHIRFNTEVRDAAFNEDDNRWYLTTTDGQRLAARILITATGQLNRPAIPTLPGVNDFRGESFHSARWNHDCDLRGKRVAVVGTGASAIQFVPHVTEQAGRLWLFQRSAPYVIAKPDRVWRGWQRRLMARLPWLQRLDRARLYVLFESRLPGFTLLRFVMKLLEWRFRWLLRRQVRDPALRRKLTPGYPMGCKRILMANDYYPALCRDHVAVIDQPVSAVRAHSIVAADGTEYPADVIIYGTGFAATDFLAPMTITGREGRELNRVWRDGARAYLGITVHGFPNLFMLYGPNTNLGHNSIIYMLESQFRYILDCLALMKRRGLERMEVRADAEDAFNARLRKKMRHTVWHQGCDSWYKNDAGIITNNWPGFTFAYRRLTRRVRPEDYQLAGETP